MTNARKNEAKLERIGHKEKERQNKKQWNKVGNYATKQERTGQHNKTYQHNMRKSRTHVTARGKTRKVWRKTKKIKHAV